MHSLRWLGVAETDFFSLFPYLAMLSLTFDTQGGGLDDINPRLSAGDK